MQSPQFISTLCHVKTMIMIVCIFSSDVIINGSTLLWTYKPQINIQENMPQTLTAYDRDIMAPVLSVSPGATWSHNIKQCSLGFPFVSFGLFSFLFSHCSAQFLLAYFGMISKVLLLCFDCRVIKKLLDQ